MTFLEAFKIGRPMRRKWSTVASPWLHLGMSTGMQPQPLWRRIDTGEVMGLHSSDYLADDWQVMP